MRAVLLYRYLHENRYYYIAVLFVYIAALSCGAFCSRTVPVPELYSYTVWSLLLKTTLPIALIAVSGLFFAGCPLIFIAVCYSAYTIGFVTGQQFGVSFWLGIIYLFFCIIPLGLIYACCTVASGVTALRCNAARYIIRRKGLSRPMNNYEIRQYISRMLICIGADIIALILEYYVFAAAYVNVAKHICG